MTLPGYCWAIPRHLRFLQGMSLNLLQPFFPIFFFFLFIFWFFDLFYFVFNSWFGLIIVQISSNRKHHGNWFRRRGLFGLRCRGSRGGEVHCQLPSIWRVRLYRRCRGHGASCRHPWRPHIRRYSQKNEEEREGAVPEFTFLCSAKMFLHYYKKGGVKHTSY